MRRSLTAVALAVLTIAGTVTPVAAEPVATTETAAAGDFIASLADRVFAILREDRSRVEIKTRFRSMLKDNFAVDEAGMRLIRRYRTQITPAQLGAYQAVLPDYVVNVYADRLINYSSAKVRIIRTQPHGATGNVDVFSTVNMPGKNPLDIIWLVQKGASGKWMIANVTVAGINMSLTQEADFSAFIAKNGFDSLVTMMKSANGKPV